MNRRISVEVSHPEIPLEFQHNFSSIHEINKKKEKNKK